MSAPSRRSRRAAALPLAALLVALAPAPLAWAMIPSAYRIANAVAEANRDAGRAEPVLLSVTLTLQGHPEPLATGELAAHPTGLARLELRSERGFVERHLLQGSEYLASRDGVPLEHPHPFLPPLFLLQADSGAALSAALASFGIEPDRTALGRVGDHDCYVLGGRPAPGERRPTLWVDLESFEIVRIQTAGARYELGPVRLFDGIRAPAWISIQAPGSPAARLDIVRAAPANAPAAAFGDDWLANTSSSLR